MFESPSEWREKATVDFWMFGSRFLASQSHNLIVAISSTL
jgi:hypothetical protein